MSSSKKASTTTSNSVGDVDSSVFYGKQREAKQPSKAAETFDHAISINEFMSDIRLRFKSDFDKAVQLSVYFFTDKSTYISKVESVYGDHYYQYVRPELISFSSVDPKTNKTINIVRTKNLEAYSDYGIKFETHIPQREWDDAAHQYKHTYKTNEDGSPVYKFSREIRTDRKVNYLIINTKQQKFVKKAGKFDLHDTEIVYYDWKVCYPPDKRNDAQYMITKLYDTVDQFSSIDLLNSTDGDEDIDFTVSE